MAAAASPQLLQAAIRRHTPSPSTTNVVPLPLADRGRQVIEAWSHSSWQAGRASYRSAVPYHPGGKRITGTKKRADSFRSFCLPSISRSGAVVIVTVALPAAAAAIASPAVVSVTGVLAHGLSWAVAPTVPAAFAAVCKYAVASQGNETGGGQGNDKGTLLHGIIPLSLKMKRPFCLCFHYIMKDNSFREALIKSLSDFILGFLFNARNQSTRIASYLRRLMTQRWIKIHMKFDSANESVLP